ncbi:MAG: cupin domain-containing protein, partial [Rhodospirillales bacterium]|nr:cupin domain-containing protein [Rhodospirillales bacterium]
RSSSGIPLDRSGTPRLDQVFMAPNPFQGGAMKTLLSTAALAALISAPVLAQTATPPAAQTAPSTQSSQHPGSPPAKPEIMSSDQIKWQAGPHALPPGAQMVVLYGNPQHKGSPFGLRLKMPDNYRLAAHSHPTDENITVVSGTFNAGMGDKLDEKKAQALAPGAFAHMPANHNHYAWTKGETVVEMHALGPFEITYVDPNDDPRRQQAQATKDKKQEK